MSTLDYYIIKKFMSALFFSLLMLVGIFWLGQMGPLIDDVILMGGDVATFSKLALLMIPRTLHIIFPVAALSAGIFTMNTLSDESELVVMNGVGLDPFRIIRPIAIASLGIFVAHVLVSLFVAPQARGELQISLYEIAREYDDANVQEGKFLSPTEGVTVFARKSTNSGEMLDVFISDRREIEFSRVYFSKRGILWRSGQDLTMVLIEGGIFERSNAQDKTTYIAFDRFEVDVSKKTILKPQKIRPDSLSSKEIVDAVWRGDEEVFAELVDRIAFPFLSLALPIIATLGWLREPYMRHGHGRIIFNAVWVGLLLEAIVFSLRGIVESNPKFVYAMIIPILISFTMVMNTYLRTRGFVSSTESK